MHAQDIKMLTVLESCALEYGVRALLQSNRQEMSSALIEDIMVPAAFSYLQFRSHFNLFIFSYHWNLLSLLVCLVPHLHFKCWNCGVTASVHVRRTLQGVALSNGCAGSQQARHLGYSIPRSSAVSLTGLILALIS